MLIFVKVYMTRNRTMLLLQAICETEKVLAIRVTCNDCAVYEPQTHKWGHCPLTTLDGCPRVVKGNARACGRFRYYGAYDASTSE
jgi:hypothetical protein